MKTTLDPKKVGGMMNLAEAKGKFYPAYKYAIVRANSRKPYVICIDRKTAEEELDDLRSYADEVMTIVDLSEVEE